MTLSPTAISFTTKEHDLSGNAFIKARHLLNLSQKELADKLNTSLFALVRWERGDLPPSEDVLARLYQLLNPADCNLDVNATTSRSAVFESSGVRSRSASMPLFNSPPPDMLKSPRLSLISDILDGNMWGDSDLALADILSRHTPYREPITEPFSGEISAGKNTYTYDAHTYHTKVPPQGIATVLSHYLPNGGLVLDPFSGSGMTGVSARTLGLDVILNELSPAASFISYNFLSKVDVSDYMSAVSHILENLSCLRSNLYSTICRECGAITESLFYVWSYQLKCNHCDNDFTLWNHCRKYGRTVREHKLLRRFPCPHCGQEVNKSYLSRFSPVPVFVGYKCCQKGIKEHPLGDYDLERITPNDVDRDKYFDYIPDLEIPDGDNLNQPKKHGLDSIAKFYTPRNALACAAIWKEINRIADPTLAGALAFAFTSLYQRVTRLSEYRFWGGSGNTANFNVPHIFNEANVFVTFERKAASIADHFSTTAKQYSGRSVVRTGSATDLSFLPDDSVDLVFTDPPFGGNINYSEMNILWEAWLGIFTEKRNEAIINRAQGKTVEEYQKLMKRCLMETFRVLRPDHWMILLFMNSSRKVWEALQQAVEEAGFIIEDVGIFDKQHGTFKQFVSDNTAGADLMIHCRKPKVGKKLHRKDKRVVLSPEEFLERHGRQVPLFPFLHVNRGVEVDYRTLYSRYLVAALKSRVGVAGFVEFRREAERKLEGMR